MFLLQDSIYAAFHSRFLPDSFANTWTTNRIRHDGQAEIELRNDDNLNIPFARTNLISLQPLISFPKIWENFPDDRIKFIRNKTEFNLELKKHYLQLLNESVECNRLFCPSCFNLGLIKPSGLSFNFTYYLFIYLPLF